MKWCCLQPRTGSHASDLVGDMLCEVAMHIESTSGWMWAYTCKFDHPEICSWQPRVVRFLLKTRGLALHANSAVQRACSRAMDFMGSYGYPREYDIEKYWPDQKVIGLWMIGKGLKTLENSRHWYDLEILQQPWRPAGPGHGDF